MIPWDVADANIGRREVAMDIGCGVHPGLRAIVPDDVDLDGIEDRIREAVKAAVVTALRPIHIEWSNDIDDGVRVSAEVMPVIGYDAQKAKWDQDHHELAQAMRPRIEATRRAIDNHPNNGTLGWWRVENFRRHAIVRASSAREAMDKADLPHSSPEWIGVELPDVVE